MDYDKPSLEYFLCMESHSFQNSIPKKHAQVGHVDLIKSICVARFDLCPIGSNRLFITMLDKNRIDEIEIESMLDKNRIDAR